MTAPPRPPLEPMRTNDYAPVIAGLVGWVIAFVVLLVRHGEMATRGQGWWLWVTVTGFAGGLWGLLLVALNHRSARRRQVRRQADAEQAERR
jgi:hypothetical protein